MSVSLNLFVCKELSGHNEHARDGTTDIDTAEKYYHKLPEDKEDLKASAFRDDIITGLLTSRNLNALQFVG